MVDEYTRAHNEPSVYLAPGTRVHQYERLRELGLGRGGKGIVDAARDIKLGREVAIKFLHNVVIIHQVDEYEGIPYIASAQTHDLQPTPDATRGMHG